MKRIDANQTEIVQALRAAGASVQSLASIGKGCPDLLVGFHGHNYLIEVKNPENRSSHLTPAENIWIDNWYGQVMIVESVEYALDLLARSDSW